MDGTDPSQEQEQKPAVEYEAQAVSQYINGKVSLTITDKALTAAALFDIVEIAFAEINDISLADYVVTVQADSGGYAFSRLGNWCQPFYDALCDKYNKAVLRSLFIKESPLLTAKGDYRYAEDNAGGAGSAPVHVYANNVTALPPDLSARRVPLCFVTGMDKGDYTVTLTLDTGESYTYSKLGYDTAIFNETVEKQIRKLREASLAAVKEIDPSLTAIQASQFAKLMPQGAAAPVGQLAGIAPSFKAALETKIAATRAAESYAAFKKMCDPALIWVGFRKNEITQDGEMPNDEPVNDIAEDGAEAPPSAVDPYLIWMIAPSPDGSFAAVEFAEANSATFVYRTDGDFPAFAKKLNRALEAIDFKREVIRLSDDELRKPENTDYYMAAKRTGALRFIRSHFAGRVIHSSAESWKKKLLELWSSAGNNSGQTNLVRTSAQKFCGQCGKSIAPDTRFCNNCGAKV